MLAVGERSAAPPRSSVGAAWKRPFDLTLLVVAGLVLAPAWTMLAVAVALAIRLEDGGRVFYTQRRPGRGGRPFDMLKFRTMAEGAERGTGAVWACADDPRATRVGAILRRLHIDELPQVVNIARGEMSWVGPRPERPEIAARIEVRLPSFVDRLAVRPGIAGLAQLRPGCSNEPKRKLRLDRLYIAKMSPLVDLRLIALCIVKTLRTEADRALMRFTTRRR